MGYRQKSVMAQPLPPADAYSFAWWKLDEPIGSTSFVDSVSGITLTSVDPAHVIAGEGGPFGNAVYVDGNGALSSTGSLSGIETRVPPSLTAGTVSVWGYLTSVGGYQSLIKKSYRSDGSWSPPFAGGLALWTNPGGQPVWNACTDGSSSYGAFSLAINANTWFLYTNTWDGTAVRVYINGELVYTQPWSGSLLTYGNGPYIIGADTNGERWTGKISDARIDSVARSSDYIRDFYKQCLGWTAATTAAPARSFIRQPADADTWAWWKLDEAAGSTTFADSSGTGVTMTLATDHPATPTILAGQPGCFGNAIMMQNGYLSSTGLITGAEIRTPGTAHASISGWLYVTDVGGFRSAVRKMWATDGSWSSPYIGGLSLSGSNGNSQMFSEMNLDGTLYQSASGSGNVIAADGDWHFIVETFPGSPHLYIDGNLVLTYNIDPGHSIAWGSGPYIIGSSASSEYWRGMICDVRIHSVARDDAWVLDHYLRSIGRKS